MPNNYCQSSTFIPVPSNLLDAAKEVIDQETTSLLARSDVDEDEYEESLNIDVYVDGTQGEEGVHILSDENFDPEQAECIIKALVESLELTGTFVCSWAYTCGKMDAGAFGGGAFAVKRGKDTVWIDAASKVKEIMESADLSGKGVN
jgi:hypothetical protein